MRPAGWRRLSLGELEIPEGDLTTTLLPLPSPQEEVPEAEEESGSLQASSRLLPPLSVLPQTPSSVPSDLLSLQPGRSVGLIGSPGFGLTRLGLTMLAGHATRGPVAYLDVRGWLCPPAAWEAGIPPERLAVVRCEDPIRWGRVASTLLEGVRALYAEVPRGIKETQLRKLSALARSRRTPLVLRPLRGDLPSGIAFLRLVAREIIWEGTEDGHGRLARRRLLLEASGKAVRGMTQIVEVEDNGTNALHLVSRLATPSSGRAVG